MSRLLSGTPRSWEMFKMFQIHEKHIMDIPIHKAQRYSLVLFFLNINVYRMRLKALHALLLK